MKIVAMFFKFYPLSTENTEGTEKIKGTENKLIIQTWQFGS